MDSILVLAVILLIVGSAAWYIRREKRKGTKCIGCPDSKTCSGHCADCRCCGQIPAENS